MLMTWLLVVHVFSASVLFASGIVTAMVLLCSLYDGRVNVIAKATRRVVISDWCLTTPAGIIQFFTGLYLGWQRGVIFEWWYLIAVFLFLLAILAWLPVVSYQVKMAQIAEKTLAIKGKLPKEFYDLFRKWFILGWPAFAYFMIVFWLMVVKP